MVCALFAAVCYGIASAMQAVAARAQRDDTKGVDPRLLIRLLGQWRYLASLGLDVAGLVAQVTALRVLPLFLVQATITASIVVTALLATHWFGATLSRAEWTSVAIVCSGLALLGSAARGEGAGHGSHGFHLALLAFACLLAGAGALVGRLPDPARTISLGLIAGLGFGTMGTAIRVLPSLAPFDLVRDPAVYAAAVAGVLAGLFYAAALQRGGVVAATAMMLIAETVPPAVIGVVVLGDHARHGFMPVAGAGFVVAVAGALALARFGEIRADDAVSMPAVVGAKSE
jgi:drug/metabolite transporter (DMT)-like permease